MVVDGVGVGVFVMNGVDLSGILTGLIVRVWRDIGC